MIVPSRSWSVRQWVCLLLAGFVLAFFWDTLLTNQVLALRDTAVSFLPWQDVVGQALREGELPLWIHFSGCGQPFLANPQVATYYPPNVIFHVVPRVLALKVWLAMHLFVAGISFYGLLRHWRLDMSPAVVGAVAFAFGTYTITRLEFLPILATVAWCPLTLYLTSRAVERLRSIRSSSIRVRCDVLARSAAPLGLVIALQFFAGAPQPLVFTLLLAGGYVVSQGLAWRDPVITGLALSTLGVACVLGLLLVMAQLLPSLEATPESLRGVAIDQGFDTGSVHPRLLASLIVPFVAGHPGYSGEWWGTRSGVFELWLGTAYVGILPLMLASRGALALRDPRRRVLAAFACSVLVVGALLAAGKHAPFYAVVAQLPFVDHFRWPSKALHLVAVALPILAALGLQSLLDRTSSDRFDKGLVAGWGVVTVGTLLAGVFATQGDFERLFGTEIPEYGFARLVGELRVAGVVLAVCLGALIVTARCAKWPRPRRKILTGLIVAICFVDLAHVGRQIHPRTDPSIYDHIPLETLRLVARASEPGGRVAVVSDRLGAQVLYGSRSAEAYRYSKDMLGGSQFRSVHMVGPIGNLIGRRYFEFTRPLRIAGESPQLQQRVLDLLSVQAVIHALPVHRVLVGGSVALKVASNRSALPRALLIRDYEVIADRTRAEARVVEPSFDPRQTVVLAVDPELSRKPVRREGDRVGEVQYGWNSTTVRLQARAPALLLLNESFAEGWEARVDGRPTPIIRANGFFRAVPVEEGTQEVHFEYRPRSAYAGLWISLVSLALTLLLWRRSLPGARSQRPTRQRIGDLFFDPKDNESSPRERLTFALVYSSTRNSRGSSSSARPKG